MGSQEVSLAQEVFPAFSAYLCGSLVNGLFLTQRAAEICRGRRKGRATPRATAFLVPLVRLSAVYTVCRAELFPRVVLNIENLVFKDDRKQLLRHFIVD